jgi:DNA primase
MSTPGDFASTVKQQADIVRIVGEYVKLKRSGAQNYSGLCPFHSEKTGSFSVHATRQFYHCFGCGASGDVFSFVQKIENITFPESVRAVAQKCGIPLPKVTFSSPEEAHEAKLRGALITMQEKACAWFQEQLQRPEAAHAREYLAGRGLTHEMIEKFRIGYAPDSGFLLRDRLKGEFDEELLKASGLFSWKETESPGGGRQSPENTRSLDSGGQNRPASARDDKARDDSAQRPATNDHRPLAIYSKFRNRVLFPICNEGGKVIAFTGRTLATDEKAGPKYLNSPETGIYSKSRVLFNLDKAKEAIRKLDYAILVEGQMDCISVFAAGMHNVIASSGTAFTEPQAKLLARFSRKIVVNFDPDTAGAAAAERSLGLLVGEDFEIKVLTLEQGFDPDLFIRRKGAAAYGEALKSAPRYFDYLIQRARTLFPPRTPEARVKAVNYLIPHVQRVPNRIIRDGLTDEIAQKLGIDSAVLRQELKHVATDRAGTQVKMQGQQSQVTQAERILIRALATASDFSGDMAASSREGADEAFDPARQARFYLQDERLHEGAACEGLIERLVTAEGQDPMSVAADDEERRLLAEILLDEQEEMTPDLLEGAALALRRRGLERRQREMQQQIAEAERKGDTARLTQLMREKVEIDRALRGHGATGTGD